MNSIAQWIGKTPNGVKMTPYFEYHQTGARLAHMVSILPDFAKKMILRSSLTHEQVRKEWEGWPV